MPRKDDFLVPRLFKPRPKPQPEAPREGRAATLGRRTGGKLRGRGRKGGA